MFWGQVFHIPPAGSYGVRFVRTRIRLARRGATTVPRLFIGLREAGLVHPGEQSRPAGAWDMEGLCPSFTPSESRRLGDLLDTLERQPQEVGSVSDA